MREIQVRAKKEFIFLGRKVKEGQRMTLREDLVLVLGSVVEALDVPENRTYK